jgi:hypothetical protein
MGVWKLFEVTFGIVDDEDEDEDEEIFQTHHFFSLFFSFSKSRYCFPGPEDTLHKNTIDALI